MGYLKEFLKKYWFNLAVLGILLIAIFLRFYDYNDRWALAYDQARDAIVAEYALAHHLLPIIGSFSSAGPFQWGPEFYWILMITTGVYPFAIITPWVVMSLLYVFFVYLIIRVAEKLIDKKFALLTGLLAAVSTAQIDQSTNLTNPSFVPIFSMFAIWAMVIYIKSGKRTLFLFLLAFFISIAISLHLQGVGLIFLLIFTVIATKSFQLKKMVVVLLGLALPFVPLLISDLQHNFFNIHNIIQYYLHDQYKVSLDVLGRRWLTYLGVFVPTFWGYIIGGNAIMGYLLSGLFTLTTLILAYKRKISSIWIILILTLLCDIFIIKNTRSPLFYGYLTFLHPLILLLSAWVLYLLMKIYKYIGLALLLIIVSLTVTESMKSIVATAKGSARAQVESATNFLNHTYPNKQFALYDYNHKSIHLSYPLMLFLWHDNKINKEGYGIGIGTPTQNEKIISGYDDIHPQIKGNTSGLIIRDLSGSSSAQLEKEGWKNVNAEDTYNSIQNWH